MICSNCEKPYRSSDQPKALVVMQDEDPVANICETCQEGTLTVKIVLSREKLTDGFKYEGYLPVSSAR